MSIKPYFLKDFSDDNFSNLYALFPLTSIPIEGKNRWDNYDMMNEYSYSWLYICQNCISLVYLPTAYPSYFDGDNIYHYKEEGSSIIRASTEVQGIKVVTGYGNVVYVHEHIALGRFAVPTQEELERYWSIIKRPEKYWQPIHRFVLNALNVL